MRKVLLASVATLGLVGTASAADLAIKAPITAPVPVYSWTGIYLGLSGGAGSGTKNYRLDQDAAVAATPGLLSRSFGPSDSSHGVDGGFFGGQLGANWQAGWAVFGIQADWYWASIEGSGSSAPYRLTLATDASFHAKAKSFGSVTGRLGAAFDRVLVYAKAGVAWKESDYEATLHGQGVNSCANTNNNCSQTQTVGQTRTGFTFGAGVELAFDHNWSAFLEYNYYDFGTEALNYAFSNTQYLAPPSYTLPYNMEVAEYLHTIKAGINYKVNWWGAPVAALGPAGTASAADLAVKSPIVAPVPVYSWTGIYLGLSGGAGSGTKNYKLDQDAALAAFPAPLVTYSLDSSDSSYDVNGGFFGGQLGANWQAGWAVFGVQADWYWANIEGRGGSAPSRLTAGADARFQAEAKSFGSLTARLGAASDRVLVYAKAGVAWEDADYEATAFGAFIDDCLTTSNCSQTQTVGQTRTGFTFGTGVELAFDHNWSAFIEYNYYDFGTEAVNYAFNAADLPQNPFTLPYNLEVTEYLHTIKAGINYKLNWWGGPVAALGPAGTASAADLAVKAPVFAPGPIYSWNGIYLGLSRGAASGTKYYKFDQDAAVAPTPLGVFPPLGPSDSSYDVNGGFFGGQLGANWQAGWAVFGVQADWYWADLEGSGRGAPSLLTTSADANFHAEVKSFGSVTGRLGAAFDRVLVYAKAGVAWEEADYEITASGTFVNHCRVRSFYCSETQTVGQTRIGFTFGTGLELAFDHNWSAFVEYNYYDFGTEAVNYAFDTSLGANPFTIPFNFEVAEYLHTIKAGVNYRFNWWDAPVVARY